MLIKEWTRIAKALRASAPADIEGQRQSRSQYVYSARYVASACADGNMEHWDRFTTLCGLTEREKNLHT